METQISKALFSIGVLFILGALLNLSGAFIIYCFWNWGLVGAITVVQEIRFSQAFWIGCPLAPTVITLFAIRHQGGN